METLTAISTFLQSVPHVEAIIIAVPALIAMIPLYLSGELFRNW